MGEAWGADVERAKLYSAPDCSELSMVFQFQHMQLDQKPGGEKWDLAPMSLVELKRVFAHWQQGLHGKGWNSLFLNNHDLPRIVSRWGNDKEYRVESAKMLATMLYGMEGTPYIYQGEEIGMTNIRLPIQGYVDIEILNMYRERLEQGYPVEEIMASIHAKGRDNARTPMQWSDEPNAGFTTGVPWLTTNPNYKEINAKAALADENSVFYYYKKLIALRKEHEVFRKGNFTLYKPEDPDHFCYIRETETERLLVTCNFTDRELELNLPTEGEVLISNYGQPLEHTLRPYEAWMMLQKKA